MASTGHYGVTTPPAGAGSDRGGPVPGLQLPRQAGRGQPETEYGPAGLPGGQAVRFPHRAPVELHEFAACGRLAGGRGLRPSEPGPPRPIAVHDDRGDDPASQHQRRDHHQ